MNAQKSVEQNTASPGASNSSVGSSGAPKLEKVSKAPQNLSKPISQASSPHVPHPMDLRPKWRFPPSDDPVTVVSPIVVEEAPVKGYNSSTPSVGTVTGKVPVLEKIASTTLQDRMSLYIIVGKVYNDGGKGTSVKEGTTTLHGIYNYGAIDKLRGKDIMTKLVTLVNSNLSDWLPPLIQTGIALGQVNVNVIYPTIPNSSVIATIRVEGSDVESALYRTYTIKRIEPNEITDYRL
jgi:hypothetical protein